MFQKAVSSEKKEEVLSEIRSVYHEPGGITGHRGMRIFLKRKGIFLSKTTVHRYMNRELGLRCICRRKKPGYRKETVRYNCTIIDLYDRSVVASVTDRWMTTDLAIKTVRKALAATGCDPAGLILHSDQGSQFTSKEFVLFCQDMGITQSMSHAGCPYDNAPMERYYNTLKAELIYQRTFHTEEDLNHAIQEFACLWYNQIRPHSHNGYQTPFEKRFALQ